MSIIARDDVMTFLPHVPLFEGVPEQAIEAATQVVQSRSYAQGDIIFQEETPGDLLYMLVTGSVKLSRVDLEGHEKTLAILHPPEFFGEMALFSDHMRSATASALSDTTVLVLYQEEFLTLLRRFPDIGLNVTRTLATRLRGMDDEAQILSYKDAQGRVAYVLLRLYRNYQAQRDPQDSVLLPLTHQDIASLAGTSRETVTRALRALEQTGAIATRPKQIIILNADTLDEILHGLY